MPSPSPASTLGQRHFPHLVDICDHRAQLAALVRPLSPIFMLIWIVLSRILKRLDHLALHVHNAPLRPPEATRPRRHHRPMAQRAPRIKRPFNAPHMSGATPPARIRRRPFAEPAPSKPPSIPHCFMLKAPGFLKAQGFRRRKPPD